MAITDTEVESIRFHLGYGNIGLGAEPYTSDGYLTLIKDVLIPNLSTAPATSSASPITAGNATVTPVAMTGIVANARLVVDVGSEVEIVAVRSVTISAFTALFTKSHFAGVPLAVLSGEARVRMLLNQADTAWQAMQDPSIGATAGLKQVDKGDVEWFQGFQVLKDRLAHYQAIVMQLASLLGVAAVNSCTPLQTSVY